MARTDTLTERHTEVIVKPDSPLHGVRANKRKEPPSSSGFTAHGHPYLHLLIPVNSRSSPIPVSSWISSVPRTRYVVFYSFILFFVNFSIPNHIVLCLIIQFMSRVKSGQLVIVVLWFPFIFLPHFRSFYPRYCYF